MAYFDTNSYRDSIRKRLDESDGSGEQPIGVEKAVYETDVLSKLREKLFGGEQNPVPTGDVGMGEDPTTDSVDTNDQLKTEDTYQDAPKTDKPLADEVGEEPSLTSDDLGDMATDTIMDILVSIKQLRDKVKKEDPKKAALIRRIYDHLLKGKEKITAEILKSHDEEQESGEPARESKW